MTFDELNKVIMNRYIRVKYGGMRIEGGPSNIAKIFGDKFVVSVEAASHEEGMLVVVLSDENPDDNIPF